MINIPKIPKPDDPAFFDSVIVQIQDILATELDWLDHVFGKSQNLVRDINGRSYQYPGVLIRNNEYQDVSPNNELGNFSFFIVSDPQQITYNKNTYNKIEAQYGLLFWVDLTSVYPDGGTIENLKADILSVLVREMRLSSGRLTVERLFEGVSNIYREHSLREVESQFLMRPYAGLRFEGTLMINEVCN